MYSGNTREKKPFVFAGGSTPKKIHPLWRSCAGLTEQLVVYCWSGGRVRLPIDGTVGASEVQRQEQGGIKGAGGFAPLSTPLRFTGWLPAVRFLRFLDLFELVSGCVST